MATELAGIRREIRDTGGSGVTFLVTGVGKQRTIANTGAILSGYPRALALVGFCGGSDPTLQTGDLHVSSAFLNAGEPDCAPIGADAGLAKALTTAARSRGMTVSVEPSATVAAVAGAATKSAVYASTGAASVNMEDYWAASVARDFGVPFASVRVVLDTADEELPGWLCAWADHPAMAGLGLFAHPARVVQLLRVGRQSQAARRSLTRCAVAAIALMAQSESPVMAVPG